MRTNARVTERMNGWASVSANERVGFSVSLCLYLFVSFCSSCFLSLSLYPSPSLSISRSLSLSRSQRNIKYTQQIGQGLSQWKGDSKELGVSSSVPSALLPWGSHGVCPSASLCCGSHGVCPSALLRPGVLTAFAPPPCPVVDFCNNERKKYEDTGKPPG